MLPVHSRATQHRRRHRDSGNLAAAVGLAGVDDLDVAVELVAHNGYIVTDIIAVVKDGDERSA